MTSSMLPRIGIVLVNLNEFEHTSMCLKTLQAITYKNIEVIVVDNNSSDKSGERIQKEFSEATVILNSSNDGFTGGNNIGINYALENGCDHVLLLNNDTIVTPSFLEPLVERLDADPMIGAVSGKIYYYPPAVGGKEKIIWYAGSYQKWHLAYSHYGDGEEDRGQFNSPRNVAYACGCLMLMRGEVIEKIGGLSDEYFIYWEEADWCLRASELGYYSWYEPHSIIYHNIHSSIPGRETPFYMYLLYRNFLIYAKRHFHGLRKIQFWFFYPLHILNRLRICSLAGNIKGAKAMFQGIGDYFKGYRGKQGLKERELLR